MDSFKDIQSKFELMVKPKTMKRRMNNAVNNNSEKMKVCRVDLIRLAKPQLIKSCRVMLERRRGKLRENQVDYFQHVHINPCNSLICLKSFLFHKIKVLAIYRHVSYSGDEYWSLSEVCKVIRASTF